MKLLVDMNLSPRWIDALRAAGYEAAHWSTMGDKSAPDSAIMAHARSGDWVVLTHDLDFGAILAATQGDRPSVVQIRADDLNPDEIAPQVLAALRQAQSELEAGALVTVEPARTRMRMLPLRTTKGA